MVWKPLLGSVLTDESGQLWLIVAGDAYSSRRSLEGKSDVVQCEMLRSNHSSAAGSMGGLLRRETDGMEGGRWGPFREVSKPVDSQKGEISKGLLLILSLLQRHRRWSPRG